jgi:lysine-N-methylase
MALPVKTLPVVQNWDCHVTGTCCHEYRVTLSDDEVARITEQGWTSEELDSLPPFARSGLFWDRKTHLNQRDSGACVFLGPTGRCRIHEKHGYEAKPLPCRLFPFVLVPAGDHWRVGLRYACPSAAGNKGRALPEHQPELLAFADMLARREKLEPRPDGSLVAPPLLDRGDRLDWPDTLRLVDALMKLLTNRKDGFERRMRRCVQLAEAMRAMKLQQLRGADLGQTLELLSRDTDSLPPHPMLVPPPGWIGRVLFRQACALFTRKDHGPNRGLAAKGRLALLGAAWRFARGKGAVPRLHRAIPETTFEQAEQPRGPLLAEDEAILERYYAIKVGSLQFCGGASFGLPFWAGFLTLALTLPVILWTARLFRDVPRDEAIMKALTIVDDHVGFNRVLGTMRQQYAFSLLARRGELAKLIAWYSR